jgi:hypothetical protein
MKKNKELFGGELHRISEMPLKYSNDEYHFQRELDAFLANDEINRRHPYQQFKKVASREAQLSALDFFETHKSELETEYMDRLHRCLDRETAEKFVSIFAEEWQDGRAERHKSLSMLSLKASIKGLLDRRTPRARHVQADENFDVDPLLTIDQLKCILKETWDWFDYSIQLYLTNRSNLDLSSNDLRVHRGLSLSKPLLATEYYLEKYYVTSYSLCISVPEQFALQADSDSKTAAIVSAQLSDFHYRILAFSPFIPGMPPGQLELCTIPSTTPIRLNTQGWLSGINEYFLTEDVS